MGNQPAAFQLHINHKLIPNVSQKVVVSFIYIQRKDGVYFMSTKKLLTLALGSALLVGGVAGCSSSVNIPSDNNTTKNVSYQAQTVSDTENAANDSTTAELPGGSVDYSIYEPYGLSYDQENYYFTYNGNVVRFFNDPIAGASFTNFFSGTVDIEADRDEENNLVGIKECSKENYDRHTQKHNNFNPTDTSLSTVQKGESTPQLWLKDYADYALPTTSRAAVGIIIIRELRYYWTVNRLLFTLMKKMEYVLLFQGMATIKFQKLKKYLKQMHNHSC